MIASQALDCCRFTRLSNRATHSHDLEIKVLASCVPLGELHRNCCVAGARSEATNLHGVEKATMADARQFRRLMIGLDR